MTEATETPAANTLAFTLNDASDISISIDVTQIPAATRRELLDTAIKALVNGRPHSAKMRFDKLDKEYKAACEVNPLFDGEAPAAPNYSEIANGAVTDLYAGKVRQRTKGGNGKQSEAKDPVDAVVTQAVVRELFAKRRAADKTVKYQDITKEVGSSGIAYLNAMADRKAGDDADRRKELGKSIDAKYIKPARAMVGVNAKGEMNDSDDLL